MKNHWAHVPWLTGGICLLLLLAACSPSPARRISLDTLPADTPAELRKLVSSLQGFPVARGQALIDLREYRGDKTVAVPFVIELMADETSVNVHIYQSGGGVPTGFGRVRTDTKERLYREEKTTVSAEARTTLSSLGGIAVLPAVHALEHKDPRIATAVSYHLLQQPGLESLTERKPEETSALVERLLKTGSPDILVGAARVAQFVRNPAHVELLLERRTASSSLVRRECLKALGTHALAGAPGRRSPPLKIVSDRRAFDAIIAAARDADMDVRAAVADLLGGCTEPEIARTLVPFAVAAAGQPDVSGLNRTEDLRDAAFRALEGSVHHLSDGWETDMRQLLRAAADPSAPPFVRALREAGRIEQFLPYLRNRWGHERNAYLLALLANPDDAPKLITAMIAQPNDAKVLGDVLWWLTGEKLATAEEWSRWFAAHKNSERGG